jgi:cytochrome o ubiquinol oxidase subunit 3
VSAPAADGVPQGAEALADERERVTAFGFYLYLLSDCILFATLFAAFAVLRGAADGGPTEHDLFSLHTAFIETACLLTSSFTCGLAMLASDRRSTAGTIGYLIATWVLGAGFLALELSEFGRMVHDGAGPDRSALLSSFFALVSTHGLHVAVGMLWLAVLLIQLAGRGLSDAIRRRLFCFSLFWHVLDIVWIALFSFIYLVGVQG